MNLLKKFSSYLIIFSFFITFIKSDDLATHLNINENTSLTKNETEIHRDNSPAFEDIDLSLCDEIDYIAKYEELKPKVPLIVKRSFIDTLGILLTGGIDQLLKEDLYLKTHRILKRPINSLPIFLIFHTEHLKQDKLVRLSLFADSTYKSFFTDDSPFINSYLGFDCPNIKSNYDKLKILTNIDLEDVIGLFRKAKKQDRRVGLQLQTLYNFDNWSLEVTMPFLYQEYNYFFTEEEKEDILNSHLFGNSTIKIEEKELMKHAVSDKLGFGDADIQIGYLIFQRNCWCAKVGLLATLPLAFELKQGMLGSNFNNKLVRPNLDLSQVVQANLSGDSQTFSNILKDFGFKALHWLNAMVLESPLGNNGHFGLGAFFEPLFRLDENVILKSRAAVEYLFPAGEERFFLTIKNQADFNHAQFEKDRENEQTAENAVKFLSQIVTETLFPNIYQTTIEPGFSLQFTLAPQFRLNEWCFSVGYDYWYQQKESINYICNPQNIPLNICKGSKPHGTQSKIFGFLSYNIVKKNYDWTISLNAEETLSSFGVGRDFALSLGFEFNF